MGLFHLDKIFGVKIRESANDGSDFVNPDADYRMLFLGEDAALHIKDSAGAVTGLTMPTGITSSVNADQNDFSPSGLAAAGWVYFDSFTADRTITGMLAGPVGAIKYFLNNTNFSILLPNEHASSLAANRFRSPNNATHTVRSRGAVWLLYASGRWNVIAP